MLRVCKWASVFIIIMFCPAYATDTENIQSDAPLQDVAVPVVNNTTQNLHYEHPNTDMPFITINTDAPLGLNWSAALEFTDPALRPTPIVLPFLTDYPIDNLEIKLRVLNLKF